MDQKAFSRLLTKLLLVPVLSLAVLAAVLGLALNQVRLSSQAVQRTGLVLSHANRLTRLMVDEETGLRGFLVTRNVLFLQPFHEAQAAIPAELATLHSLLPSYPEQLERLRKLEDSHARWESMTAQEIGQPDIAARVDFMLARKGAMDAIRARSDDFIRAEEQSREDRLAWARRLDRLALAAVLGFTALVALVIAWITRRIFAAASVSFEEQLTEAHRSRQEATERGEWLGTTLRSIGDAVIACNPDGNVSFMNAVAEDLTGWSEAEATGQPLATVFRIVNEHSRKLVESPVDKVRRLGSVVGLANHTVLLRPDGTEVSIDDSGAPIRNGEGALVGIVLVFRDITERKVSEIAMLRAEKLAAAGRLAASIAHEVNNPLEGLMNLVYIAHQSEEIPEIKSLLVQADAELQRISHITRQSLGFYRENSAPMLYSPSTILREVASFYTGRSQGRDISLRTVIRTEVQILGSPGELRQVISNLLANSIDAAAAGCTVQLRLNRALDPRDPSVAGVRITVADDGCGIPSGTLRRIFEPFFTTKEETGTGLGLWVSKELVEKHGGHIHVRSRFGDNCISPGSNSASGTVFSFFLPLIPASEMEPAGAGPIEDSADGASETDQQLAPEIAPD